MATITLDTIQPFPEANGYAVNGTVLRVWYSRSFLDSDGTFVEGGSGSQGFYIPVTCTVTASEVTIPAFDLWTTIDSQDSNPLSIRCFAQLYSNGTPKAHVFSGASTPTGWTIFNPDPATSWTFENLLILNQVGTLTSPPDNLYPTVQQMIDFQNSITYANASAVTKGITKLSVAPVLSTNPIAVGKNDYATTSNNGIVRLNQAPDVSTLPEAVGSNWYRLGEMTRDISEFRTPDAPPNLSNAITSLGSVTPVTLAISTNTTVDANVTVPTNIVLRFINNGYLTMTTGRTCTIKSDPSGYPKRKIFYNALSGQGTVSFADNNITEYFYPQWWGALNDGVTDSITFLNAVSAAADSAGGGTIRLTHGDGFPISTGWVVNPSGGIKAINVIGESATAGGIIWTGATNTWAVKFNRNKYAKMSQVRISSTVAVGTTTGLLLTGPSSGEQSANDELNNLIIGGFFYGMDFGDGTAAVGQIPLNSCYLDGNTIGLRCNNFNTLNINLYNSSFLNNTQYGIQANVYNLNVFGGSFANNTLADFDVTANMGTYLLAGIRTELSTAGSFIIGGNIENITIQNLLVQSNSVSTAPLILSDGVIALRGSSIHPGAASSAMTIFQSQGGAPFGYTSFICEGNQINSGATLFDASNGNNVGLYYILAENQKWELGAPTPGRFADETGRLVSFAIKSSLTRLNAGLASTPTSPAQITANQNNYNAGAATLFLRLNTDASRNITGLTFTATQIDGQQVTIINVGAQDIVLKHQDAASTAANRFLNTGGADITLTANQQAAAFYDGTSARWRVSKLP